MGRNNDGGTFEGETENTFEREFGGSEGSILMCEESRWGRWRDLGSENEGWRKEREWSTVPWRRKGEWIVFVLTRVPKVITHSILLYTLVFKLQLRYKRLWMELQRDASNLWVWFSIFIGSVFYLKHQGEE